MKKKCFLLWTNTKLEKWINVSSLGCRSWTNYFQLQYASPSWSGFLSAADCSRLQAILNNTDFFQIIHLQLINYFSPPTNLWSNQSSITHTTFCINFSHLSKTQAILCDPNRTNIPCLQYLRPMLKRVL